MPGLGAKLQEQFGGVDVYLFDQFLKGRFDQSMRVLDAGCGSGRNLVYFLREGFDVCGVDTSHDAIVHVRSLARTLAPHLPEDNFRQEPVEKMSFADGSFDAVLSSAVLHFARDEAHWLAMLREMWRVLKPGGVFFSRLASSEGVEGLVEHLGGETLPAVGRGRVAALGREDAARGDRVAAGRFARPAKDGRRPRGALDVRLVRA